MSGIFKKLKIIDRMMIKAFVPPFLLSFLIALFVLTLQFFWLYIDEIMGKGVGFFQIIELISYQTISLMPLALPIGSLLASVMVFGNLGERYELSSLKSAGISLTRIMAPIVILGLFISLFSYFSSNFIIPKANLKFLTRLYDIRRQKPALAIEPGVFNDDFYGYSIYVGKKGKNKIDIEDVMVYDQNKSSDLIMVTRASRGKMYTTDRGNRFVMELYDGEQVEEPNPQYKSSGTRTYPLVRTQFAKFTKSFDLEEFKINSTDENRFKDNQKMITNEQILEQIDTLRKQIISGQKKAGLGINNLFDTAFNAKQARSAAVDTLKNIDSFSNSVVSRLVDSMKRASKSVQDNYQNDTNRNTTDTTQLGKDTAEINLYPEKNIAHFYELIPKDKKAVFFKSTVSQANLVQSEITNVTYTLASFKKKEVLYWQQYHQKFTFAIACLIFIFIGAPMGAIVRKGGFGYPLLIAIVFFVIYIMSSKLFEKLTDTFKIEVHVGMWLTTLIIGTIGLFLTYKASKDQSSNFIANLQDAIVKWWQSRKSVNPKTKTFM